MPINIPFIEAVSSILMVKDINKMSLCQQNVNKIIVVDYTVCSCDYPNLQSGLHNHKLTILNTIKINAAKNVLNAIAEILHQFSSFQR